MLLSLRRGGVESASILALLVLFGAVGVDRASGRPGFRQAFFDAYPGAIGTRLDNLPSNAGHCGVCHYDFNGRGPLNPYGVAVRGTPNRTAAEIYALGGFDSDGDGFSNAVEILDPGGLYSNTPTFPGLTAANVGSVSNVSVAEIQDHLTPVVGPDREPPEVTVLSPNGGESLGSSSTHLVRWIATDNSGTVSWVNVFVSFDGGVLYDPLALGIYNSGELEWSVQNRPTTEALVRVTAVDPSNNVGSDESDGFFEIFSAAAGRVPTTLRDFDMPGTQPLDTIGINPPIACSFCHGNYDPAIEPYFNWEGGMMAHASIDPLFLAALEVANQDAPESGDMCLRCHTATGWVAGRSTPTDGSRLEPFDLTGVSCDQCHRLVDPFYEPGASPPEDLPILNALRDVPLDFTNAQYVIDPDGMRRGPFADALRLHEFLVSPFHWEAALCGTCHDVSNPVFERQPNGEYLPNVFDQRAPSFGPHEIGVAERTYSEWLHSDYNTPQGVYAPQFGGNRDYVSTCQDCHMRDVTGPGCNEPGAPIREDLPLHDMTGGSAWMLSIMDQVDPTLNVAALQAGVLRARYMLENAAELGISVIAERLAVRVTNHTGHKMPTGYPEGRRAWLNVRFYDAGGALIGESGAYDPNTAELTLDPQIKVYEAKPVIGENIAAVVGLPADTEFHFVLNNKMLKDNRIPPLGFTNAEYETFGGAPVGATYADGQNYDVSEYTIPVGTVRAEVTLYYQSLSKEFVEFLRDNAAAGVVMYDLWDLNGRCPPEWMAGATVGLGCVGDLDGDGDTDLADLGILLADFGCPQPGPCVGDLDGDGDTDLADLGILLADFGCAP